MPNARRNTPAAHCCCVRSVSRAKLYREPSCRASRGKVKKSAIDQLMRCCLRHVEACKEYGCMCAQHVKVYLMSVAELTFIEKVKLLLSELSLQKILVNLSMLRPGKTVEFARDVVQSEFSMA